MVKWELLIDVQQPVNFIQIDPLLRLRLCVRLVSHKQVVASMFSYKAQKCVRFFSFSARSKW